MAFFESIFAEKWAILLIFHLKNDLCLVADGSDSERPRNFIKIVTLFLRKISILISIPKKRDAFKYFLGLREGGGVPRLLEFISLY